MPNVSNCGRRSVSYWSEQLGNVGAAHKGLARNEARALSL